MNNRNIFRIISLTSIWLWFGLFALIPVALVFLTSFLTPGLDVLVRFRFTVGNYLQLFNGIYVKIFLQSFYLAGSCTLICFLLAYPFAYIIARTKSKYKTLFLLLIIIPFWTNSLIRTYAIMILLKAKGLINIVLMATGIINHPLQLLYGYFAVLVGCVYDLLPFMILPLYASIEKIDQSLLEAAHDLGASRLYTLRKVVVPLTMPGIIAGILLVFLPAMTMFYIPVLLGGAKNLLLGNLIENQFLSANNWPLGSATSIIITALLLFVLFIYWVCGHKKAYEDLL